jgi:hypothetical protein
MEHPASTIKVYHLLPLFLSTDATRIICITAAPMQPASPTHTNNEKFVK